MTLAAHARTFLAPAVLFPFVQASATPQKFFRLESGHSFTSGSLSTGTPLSLQLFQELWIELRALGMRLYISLATATSSRSPSKRGVLFPSDHCTAGLESPYMRGSSMPRLAKTIPRIPKSRFDYIHSIVLRQENVQLLSNEENFYLIWVYSRLPLEPNQLTCDAFLWPKDLLLDIWLSWDGKVMHLKVSRQQTSHTRLKRTARFC